jgi:hypothetical protein
MREAHFFMPPAEYSRFYVIHADHDTIDFAQHIQPFSSLFERKDFALGLFIAALKYPFAADTQERAGPANTQDAAGAADTEDAPRTTNAEDTPGATDAQDAADAVQAQDAQGAADAVEAGVGRSGPAQESFKGCRLWLLCSDHCSLYPFRMLVATVSALSAPGAQLRRARVHLFCGKMRAAHFSTK